MTDATEQGGWIGALLLSMALVSVQNSAESREALPQDEVQSSLTIIALEPSPNYTFTQDAEDFKQLTDGRYNAFPFWTSRDSVGWSNRTPVVISATAKSIEGIRYELLFRTARQTSADVSPPRRIDVYCQPQNTTGWQHAGVLAPDTNGGVNGGVVELSLVFVGCGGERLQVVIHADGPYVMLDEISLTRMGRQPMRAPASPETAKEEIRLLTAVIGLRQTWLRPPRVDYRRLFADWAARQAEHG